MEITKRYHIIQAYCDALRKKGRKVNYLEIGVRSGECFLKIKADKKTAVDPQFVIPIGRKFKNYMLNGSNFSNKFFEITSDDFFAQQADYIKKLGGIDVVFIDGLHLYEQVMNDIENSLQYLNENGVILMHDCNPPFAAAAIRGYSPQEIAKNPPPGWTGEWNGDVWKSIVNLRSTRNDLNIRVYDCDYGIGQIRKGKPDNMLSYTIEEIEKMTYDDLDKNRVEMINLKPASEVTDYIAKNL